MPKIEIIGDRDRFVRTGSTVSLRCVINQSLEAPSYLFWYHKGDQVLSDRYGKLDIHPPTQTENGFGSSLVIHNARPEDSGNYTCSPSNLDSASVTLHVLNGESSEKTKLKTSIPLTFHLQEIDCLQHYYFSKSTLKRLTFFY